MTIDEKRLAEIREILGPRTADDTRGAFPIEDAADDLLAMLDAMRARAEAAERSEKEAQRASEDAIAKNSETLDAIVELVRPGAVLDDAGAIDAVRELVKRAEDAERNLAALLAATVGRDAANDALFVLVYPETHSQEWHARLARVVKAERDYDETVARLSSHASVADRHDRKVRAKELRRLAGSIEREGRAFASYTPTWFRDEADRIERGES